MVSRSIGRMAAPAPVPSHHYPHHLHQHGGRLKVLIKVVPTASDHPNSTLKPTCHLVSRACQVKADRRRRRAAALALPASKLVALETGHLVLSLEWWCVVGKAPSWARRLWSDGICTGASI